MTAQFNAADLRAKIDGHIKNLAQLTDQAAASQAIQDFIQLCSKFHQYSWNNQFLIYCFNPEATRVAGYKRWLELNRYVKKGEKGIPILAPCIYRTDPCVSSADDDENSPKEVKGFRVVYVFDVAQTDGEPLPEPPNWKSPAKQAELEFSLLQFARRKDIEVVYQELQGETQGVSSGGKITLSPGAGTKTLIHEIAHELLHQGEGRGWMLKPGTRELEAEAIAFVVASHFGINNLASPNYLALWEADAEKIAQRADRIRKVASEIISAIEQEGEP